MSDEEIKDHLLSMLKINAGEIDGNAQRPLSSSTSGWGYIYKTGQMVIQPQFDDESLSFSGNFSEGLTPVKIGGKWGFMGKTGQMVIEPQFDGAHSFSNGVACVDVGEKCGFIDKTGQIVIEPQFDKVELWDGKRFCEGLANVEIDGKGGFIDKTGQVVIELEFDAVMPFSEGLASVKVGEKYTG